MDDSCCLPGQASESQQAYDDYASGSNGMPSGRLPGRSGIGDEAVRSST